MYVYRYAKNNHFPIDFAIFTKALRTDRQTDRRTDKPSYRDAIAASKKKIYDTLASFKKEEKILIMQLMAFQKLQRLCRYSISEDCNAHKRALRQGAF